MSQHLAFIDNEAGKHALLKGCCKCPAVNRSLGIYWTYHAQAGKEPWLERVASEDNISDKVSRLDTKWITETQWPVVNFDMSQIWPILFRISHDEQFAYESSAAMMADILQPQARQACLNAGLRWEV